MIHVFKNKSTSDLIYLFLVRKSRFYVVSSATPLFGRLAVSFSFCCALDSGCGQRCRRDGWKPAEWGGWEWRPPGAHMIRPAMFRALTSSSVTVLYFLMVCLHRKDLLPAALWPVRSRDTAAGRRRPTGTSWGRTASQSDRLENWGRGGTPKNTAGWQFLLKTRSNRLFGSNDYIYIYI